MENILKESHLNELKQNIEYQTIIEPSITLSMLTQDKENIE